MVCVCLGGGGGGGACSAQAVINLTLVKIYDQGIFLKWVSGLSCVAQVGVVPKGLDKSPGFLYMYQLNTYFGYCGRDTHLTSTLILCEVRSSSIPTGKSFYSPFAGKRMSRYYIPTLQKHDNTSQAYECTITYNNIMFMCQYLIVFI